MPIKLDQYHYLDEALSHSTAAEPITVWHGYEANELDLLDFVNNSLGIDIFDADPSEVLKVDLSSLINKSYRDYAWCATTFDPGFAYYWASLQKRDMGMKNVPVLELNLDPSVNCAYISYSRKRWFDKQIYLAWPHELQMLTQRNLNFKVTKAEWIPQEDFNYLHITVTATK